MPVEITALAGTAALMLTGILSTRDVLSSFANSGPLTVVCMFILSASLERTGLIGDLSKLFNKVAKGRELTALLVITLGAFMVSPFVNNTPVVVILMPIVLAFCRDHNIAASKLLIPLSYATILGGTCSVVGTSTNVVVLGQVQKLGYEGIQMFTVTPMGLIYAAAGLLYLWTFGRKWLPSRPTLSTMLPGGIQRDFLLQVRIPADSPHIGATPVSLMQSELLGTKIVEVRRKGFSMQEELQHINLEEGDRILFLCNARKVNQVREARGVDLGWDDSRGLETLEQRDVQIVEGMIANNSEFAGLSLSELEAAPAVQHFCARHPQAGQEHHGHGAGYQAGRRGHSAAGRPAGRDEPHPDQAAHHSPEPAPRGRAQPQQAGLGHPGHGAVHLHRAAGLL